jgi:hypothetical protein
MILHACDGKDSHSWENIFGEGFNVANLSYNILKAIYTLSLECNSELAEIELEQLKGSIYLFQCLCENNEMIVLTGKGNAISEDNRGDVKIQIKVKNDTQFKRDGLDLILERSISLKEALCGFSFEMKFIDGRVFKINNDNGNVICPGYKKLVNGLGIARDDKIGNLIIHFNIVFPEHLSSEAIAAISGAL